jgi:hypothetical protein
MYAERITLSSTDTSRFLTYMTSLGVEETTIYFKVGSYDSIDSSSIIEANLILCNSKINCISDEIGQTIVVEDGVPAVID